MNRTRLSLIAVAAVAAAGLGLSTLNTADAAAAGDPSLKGVNWGTYVTGPKLKKSDLEGKVIVFEYWGDRCGPCQAAIPHLVELQEKHGRDKVIIVANQVWTKSADAAKKAWLSRTDKDVVTVTNHGAIPGVEVRGVPHSFVFDANGKFIWRGHPSNGLDAAIDKALEASPKEASVR